MHSLAVIEHHIFIALANFALSRKFLLKKTRLTLLKSLGQERKLTDAGLESITEFMRLVIYTGKDDECTELSLRHHAYAG